MSQQVADLLRSLYEDVPDYQVRTMANRITREMRARNLEIRDGAICFYDDDLESIVLDSVLAVLREYAEAIDYYSKKDKADE